MLPKKLGEVLRIVSPRKMAGTSYNSSNRFSALRSKSRSKSRNRNRNRNRSRSNSVRNNEEIPTVAVDSSATDENPTKTFMISLNEEYMTKCKTELETIATACDAVERGIADADATVHVKELLGGITHILRSFGKIQNALLSLAVETPTATKSYANAAKSAANLAPPPAQNGGKKQRKGSTRNQQQVGTYAIHESEDLKEKDRKYYRFKDTIRDAERSTLIFNLNLGRNPIMDQETMSTRATLALGKKAAMVEKSTAEHPSEATREILDDAIGMADKIHFYGRQTKSYRNPKDPASGSYCTLPARYDFATRDLRIRVEKIMREKCDANCATPYPLVVRECIKRVAAATKAVYPDCAVRVNVDAHNFCLRVGTKAKTESKFYWIRKPVPLPACALDTELKTLPKDFDFEVTLIPRESAKNNTDDGKHDTDADGKDNATPMDGDNVPS